MNALIQAAATTTTQLDQYVDSLVALVCFTLYHRHTSGRYFELNQTHQERYVVVIERQQACKLLERLLHLGLVHKRTQRPHKHHRLIL
jgi:hypothetical protein